MSGGLQAEESSRSRFPATTSMWALRGSSLDSLVQSELEVASQGRPVRRHDVRGGSRGDTDRFDAVRLTEHSLHHLHPDRLMRRIDTLGHPS